VRRPSRQGGTAGIGLGAAWNGDLQSSCRAAQ